jgi:hypothetical protein
MFSCRNTKTNSGSEVTVIELKLKECVACRCYTVHCVGYLIFGSPPPPPSLVLLSPGTDIRLSSSFLCSQPPSPPSTAATSHPSRSNLSNHVIFQTYFNFPSSPPHLFVHYKVSARLTWKRNTLRNKTNVCGLFNDLPILQSWVRVPYCLRFETPPARRARSPYLYPQNQGVPVVPPGIGFPFRHLLRLAGLRWRYSNQPPRGVLCSVLINAHSDKQKMCFLCGPRRDTLLGN